MSLPVVKWEGQRGDPGKARSHLLSYKDTGPEPEAQHVQLGAGGQGAGQGSPSLIPAGTGASADPAQHSRPSRSGSTLPSNASCLSSGPGLIPALLPITWMPTAPEVCMGV